MSNYNKLNHFLFFFPLFLLINQAVCAKEIQFIQNQRLVFETFSLKVFLKEFIYTNSNDDYLRSLQRLKDKHLIDLSINYKDTINKKLTIDENNNIVNNINNLIKEAKDKANFKSNSFYIQLKEIINNNKEWNSSALYEQLIVKELLRNVSKSVSNSKSSNNIYYKYILNHSRYEIIVNFLKTKKVKLYQNSYLPTKKVE